MHTERNAPLLKRLFIKAAGRRVDAIHYNGILCHDFLRELGYPEYKLKPGNMTVDIRQLARRCDAVSPEARAQIRASLGISSDEIVFLFLGQLIPRKGVSQLLRGWRQWCGDFTEKRAKLLVVGFGSEEIGLKRFCSENNLSNVLFAPHCKYEDVPRYLAMADVFTIPTLEDNWSLVVPEAMSCGKPILCSCYNGCHPELVHPENGWVFDPLNTEDVATKLEAAYRAEDDFAAMGEASRRLVKLYSPEEIVSGLLRTCRETILPPKLPLIPRCVEISRRGFDKFLMKKVHRGCVSHYRKMMRMNAVRNRHVEGEKEYLAQWKRLSGDVAKEDFRLFSRYIPVSSDTVPESVSHNVVEAIMAPTGFRSFYSDKNMFDLLMPEGMLPKTYLRRMGGVFRDADYRIIKDEAVDLAKVLHGVSRCVVKPAVDSSSGRGVTVFEADANGFRALNGELRDEKMTVTVLKRFFGTDFIIQEYLMQSDFMKNFCSTSVNTIRLFVYRSVKTEEVEVPAIIMRLGHTGSLVDNSHAGGVSVGVDHEGNIGSYATDQYGRRYTVVNDIDFQHTKLRIPDFGRVLEFAKEVGRHLLHHRIANIDVMIDKDERPRLIEVNLNSMSTWLYQFDSGNAYGSFAGEIIEYCQRHRDEVRHVLIEY